MPTALMNFFRPSGLNPAIAIALLSDPSTAGCVQGVAPLVFAQSPGLSAACDPTTLTGCVPFSDMDANYSNGSSIYHGLTANLKKRFGNHYEFLASYTWSHAIDDSTDLQSPLAPQDSYFPSAERSTSLFDQRHRLVFSGVYQSGKLSGTGFASRFFSNWTLAPILEFASGQTVQHHHRQPGQFSIFTQHQPSERGRPGHAGDALRPDRGFEVFADGILPGTMLCPVCRRGHADPGGIRRQPQPQRRPETVDGIQRRAGFPADQLRGAHEPGSDRRHFQSGQPI